MTRAGCSEAGEGEQGLSWFFGVVQGLAGFEDLVVERDVAVGGGYGDGGIRKGGSRLCRGLAVDE